jgi:hypothetical protein
MGRAAHERVREHHLGTHSLVDYLALIEKLLFSRVDAGP